MSHRPMLVEIVENPWPLLGALGLVAAVMALASDRVQTWWWQYRIVRDLRRRRGQ